jgi:phage anti-repressor protein
MKIDLSIKNIREEFINHILELISEEKLPISKEFLDRYILLTIENKEEFSVSLEDATEFLNISTDDMKKILGIGFKKRRKIYKKNVSYTERNGKYFLTIDCFKDLCMTRESEIGQIMRLYFINMSEV